MIAILLLAFACHRELPGPKVNTPRDQNQLAEHGRASLAGAATRPQVRDPDQSSAKVVDATSGSTAQRMIILLHDFGLVRPNQRMSHRFRLPTETAISWTVASISRNCACTVADVTREYIEATYNSGRAPSDDHRVLEIQFHESEAPIVRLEIKAAVRPPVVLSPSDVSFHAARKNFRGEQFIEVENFSGDDWQTIVSTSDAAWLSADAELWRVEDRLGAPRQIWRVTLVADADSLRPGRYGAEVQLRCEGDATNEARLPVHFSLSGPVQAIPERMFFGLVDADGRSSCSIRLRCIDHPAAEVAERLSIAHDLGDRLQISVSQESKDFLKVTGALALPADVAAIECTVRIHLNDADRTVIELGATGLPLPRKCRSLSTLAKTDDDKKGLLWQDIGFSRP